MHSWDFQSPGLIAFGEGKAACVGPLVKNRISGKILLVTGPVLLRTGAVEPVLQSLREADVSFALHAETSGEPTSRHVEDALALFRRENCTALVACGGGGPMDLAKAVSLLHANGGSPADYARKVLDALLSNYFNYYGERHVDSDLFPNNAVNVSVDNYEYVDCVEMLRTNANESIGYLNKRAEEKYDFYSVKTGYSFADLADCYNYLKNNNLSDLYAYIIANKLVKDCDVMINKKQNDALQYQLQIDSLTKNISKAKSIIDQFGDKTIEGQFRQHKQRTRGKRRQLDGDYHGRRERLGQQFHYGEPRYYDNL